MVDQHDGRSFRWTRAAGVVAAVLALGLGCSSSDEQGAGDESPAAEAPVRVSTRGPAQQAPASPADAPETDDAAPEAAGAPEREAAETDPAPSQAEAAAEDPVGASAFASCITSGGAYSDCETIYVTVVQTSPARCVQLSIDDCGSYSRQGLSADAPSSWRLASASVASSASPCELGVFYPGSTSIDDATGSIRWNEETSRPTAIELELTLQPVGAEAASIAVSTVTPLDPVACDE